MEITDCDCVSVTEGHETGDSSSPRTYTWQCGELTGGITGAAFAVM
jgi:hypothetical protein